jgi:hypothetical protein
MSLAAVLYFLQMQEVHEFRALVERPPVWALKEAAINAKPELDSDTRTDRGSAVERACGGVTS